MLLPRKEDILHKAWLLRLLTAICDSLVLASRLRFKGGTCAALRGLIDRFSVDLDFDLISPPDDLPLIRKEFSMIFQELGLAIKDESKKVPQYFLRYPVVGRGRNTIKIDTLSPPPNANIYEAVSLTEIDRICQCQTIPTLVANKMVAILDRYEKSEGIAGRDLFDLHAFLLKGLEYRAEIIVERRHQSVAEFLRDLIHFVEKRVTATVIQQDLNHLLLPETFLRLHKILKSEVLGLLRDELKRIS